VGEARIHECLCHVQCGGAQVNDTNQRDWWQIITHTVGRSQVPTSQWTGKHRKGSLTTVIRKLFTF
jgi:hypothetical protein